jgi:hypothetical protein
MLLAPLALLVGLAAGLVARPGGRRPVRARALPVLAAGWLLEVVLAVAGVPVPGALAALATAAVLAAALANLRMVGATVVALGLAADLAVLAANGAVPVRPRAMAAAGVPAADLPGGREVEGAGTRLAVLGEIVPVPGLPLVVSFGDLVALVGAADVTANAVRGRRRRRAGDAVVVHLDERRAPMVAPWAASTSWSGRPGRPAATATSSARSSTA